MGKKKKRHAGYTYDAVVKSVYDGDTLTVLIDLGFNASLKMNIRILGIDTPEIRTKNKKEKEFGIKVRDYLRKKIEGKEVTVITEKPDKFGGRYLAHVYFKGFNIAEQLIKKGYAKPYFGARKEPWDFSK